LKTATITLSHCNDCIRAACPGNAVSDFVNIQHRIIELELEHRELDAAITALAGKDGYDELQVKRMKKRKLLLKDQITLLKLQLTPDIPA
jgi:hypothetical protein